MNKLTNDTFIKLRKQDVYFSKITHYFTVFFKKNELSLILLVLLLCNFCLRWIYDLKFSELPFYFDQMHINYQDKTWYTYMIPSMAKAWGGTWSSFGIGLLPVLNHFLGSTGSYLLLNSLFVTSAYALSWLTFRSKIFTITVGICTAFTTLNYHVYQNSACIAMYISFIFCFMNLYTLHKLFENKDANLYWWSCWILSLFLYIGSLEGWLDYYAVILLVSPVALFFLKKQEDAERFKRLIKMDVILSIIALVYIICKIKFGYASRAGEEHDLIFNYGLRFDLIIEDFISNFFTFFYTTITTYIPTSLMFSNSYLHYGPEKIIALQGGYDPSYTSFSAINALVLWRFYAGVYLTFFCIILYKIFQSLRKTFDIERFYIFIFMCAVLFAAPTHMLIKFRPFHLIPWLAYQPFIGQIGLMCLMGYSLKLLHEYKNVSKKYTWLITIIVWSSVILCGFTKYKFYDLGVVYGNFHPNI